MAFNAMFESKGERGLEREGERAGQAGQAGHKEMQIKF